MSKPSKKQTVKPFIQPLIKTSGEKHLFEEMNENGELPIIKSVGFCRVSPKSKNFVSYVITSQGDKILTMEVSEPDARAIAEDNSKTSFVSTFMNYDSEDVFQNNNREEKE